MNNFESGKMTENDSCKTRKKQDLSDNIALFAVNGDNQHT